MFLWPGFPRGTLTEEGRTKLSEANQNTGVAFHNTGLRSFKGFGTGDQAPNDKNC